jgi:hypothetical protein
VNIAQKAHIRSFSVIGPRGRQGIEVSQLNSTENLMLVCHQCHREIDSPDGEKKYTVDILKAMKRRHEERVEVVCDAAEERSSHIVLYGSNIGERSPVLSFKQAASAMLPSRFPASSIPILLQQSNDGLTELDPDFWRHAETNLVRLYERKIRDRINDGDVRHLSVFALAAQPLLVRLGVLLGDIAEVDVYQRHREPPTWAWPDFSEALDFQVRRPEDDRGVPALVIGISGTITNDRVTAVLGDSASIWCVTIPTPSNDSIKSRLHLLELRKRLRQLFDEIKATKGQRTELHVFLAAPVSVCVELGRVRMPKADMPWLLYDHNNSQGGFQPAISIQ